MNPQRSIFFSSSDIPPIANGSAAKENLGSELALIPNGGPSTLVPRSPETPIANGVANGHITPMQESPFTGYIIAMHRKMVRAPCLKADWVFCTMQQIRPVFTGK